MELRAILDESALHRLTGDRDVMASQLDYLAEVVEWPNVDLRILPLDAGVHAAAFGSFMLFTSPGATGPYMACVEDRAGPHYLDRAHEIAVHVALFDYLSDVARPRSPPSP